MSAKEIGAPYASPKKLSSPSSPGIILPNNPKLVVPLLLVSKVTLNSVKKSVGWPDKSNEKDTSAEMV